MNKQQAIDFLTSEGLLTEVNELGDDKAVAGSTDQRNIASSVSAGVRYDKVFRGLPFSLCAMAVRSRCVN